MPQGSAGSYWVRQIREGMSVKVGRQQLDRVAGCADEPITGYMPSLISESFAINNPE